MYFLNFIIIKIISIEHFAEKVVVAAEKTVVTAEKTVVTAEKVTDFQDNYIQVQ